VTGGARTFETGIEGSTAVLPNAPRYWSYSSLKEVEACPLRYSLSRASYPNLWERRGFPQAPVHAALFGDVVHAAIEWILKAFVAAGCSSATSAEAVTVLKALGGYTAVAEQVLAERLAQLDGNPRLRREQRQRLARELEARIPDARGEIQEYLSRMPPLRVALASSSSDRKSHDRQQRSARHEIADGPHPELSLVADSLRLLGRVDLLTLQDDGAHITDFKTGAEDPGHREQLLTYALLWARDQIANPHRRPCRELRAAYPNREASFPIPDEDTLAQHESNLVKRIEAADEAAETPSPEARLSDRCGLCGVRPLCAVYWADRSVAAVPSNDGEWFDLEGTVASRHGAKSWIVGLAGGRGTILVRTPSPSEMLPLGKAIRVLRVRRVVDPDEPGALIAAMGGSTETFLVCET
jgi:PD-(D/E)XK nuclease superfamily